MREEKVAGNGGVDSRREETVLLAHGQGGGGGWIGVSYLSELALYLSSHDSNMYSQTYSVTTKC